MITLKQLLMAWGEDTVFVVREEFCTIRAKKSAFFTEELLKEALKMIVFNIIIKEDDEGSKTVYCFAMKGEAA